MNRFQKNAPIANLQSNKHRPLINKTASISERLAKQSYSIFQNLLGGLGTGTWLVSSDLDTGQNPIPKIHLEILQFQLNKNLR